MGFDPRIALANGGDVAILTGFLMWLDGMFEAGSGSYGGWRRTSSRWSRRVVSGVPVSREYDRVGLRADRRGIVEDARGPGRGWRKSQGTYPIGAR